MIAFKYRKEKNSSGSIVFRPVADLILKTDFNSIEASMYIDSGADISLIPLSVGLALGLTQKPSEIREMKGVAKEPIPFVQKELKLTFQNITIDVRVAWALIEEVPLLLGRLDVFTKFKIVFDELEKKILFIQK